ncbi:MAG: Ribulose-phosphate 3-epimerase [Candidatus Gottesmanbacteria bacterium GW2011_GWA1_34_13]|uniref:Ribulose-phosphate 3-epimerase n=1 Tax=Candidatus Gottesmanbacteria bacterium GW2011_GWA1_34_13 TaxID=1618434 RepID=A0A0G0B6A7_9BACT|nr:MAG: Ribulose-phosphate 3-epimerase [Candidatus Gottesmanbacteria bacterium GW2011_GWA1_34_13]
MLEIIPGINEKNYDNVLNKIQAVEGLVDWVQIDIMDNTLVQNDTYNNWESFKSISSQIKLEAHLMVLNPHKYVKYLVDNGFKRLIAQVETPTSREFIDTAKTFLVEIGLAIDTTTNLEVIEPFLPEVDSVLIMTAPMGASGQEFDANQLFKIKQIHELNPDLPIEIDGGVNKDIVPIVCENGATRLVSTNYIFQNLEHVKERIEELKNSA